MSQALVARAGASNSINVKGHGRNEYPVADEGDEAACPQEGEVSLFEGL